MYQCSLNFKCNNITEMATRCSLNHPKIWFKSNSQFDIYPKLSFKKRMRLFNEMHIFGSKPLIDHNLIETADMVNYLRSKWYNILLFVDFYVKMQKLVLYNLPPWKKNLCMISFGTYARLSCFVFATYFNLLSWC